MELLHPQEIEVYYIIPSLRSAFAKLMKANGMTNTDIAKIFGMNKSAITQYIKNKRGNQVEFDSKVTREIKVSSKKIKDQLTFIRETQKLLKFIRNNSICKIHKELTPCMKDCNSNHVICTHE